MNFKYVRELPTPQELKAQLPLSDKLSKIKSDRDKEIKDIIEGKNDKFILIIGPCSADSNDSVCRYMEKLGKVSEKVSDKIMIIPRIYTNKPRTTGEGYKGMLHQPNPLAEPNILSGLTAIRQMFIDVLEVSHLSGADEMLYPMNLPYLDDLLSYIAIGARSVENQKHRLVSSGVDIPVGMKNPTSGDLTVMLNSVKAAQIGHSFIYSGHEVETPGNPLAHTILRGAVNQYGRNIPNYHFEDLIFLAKRYRESGLNNPSVIIDTNHANSMKQYEQQPRIAMEIMQNRNEFPELKTLVKGLMIESYLEDGKQNAEDEIFGKSITDPCLGWAKSEELIYRIADSL